MSSWFTIPDADLTKSLAVLKYDDAVPTVNGRTDPYSFKNELMPWEMIDFNKKEKRHYEGQKLQNSYGDKLPQELYDALDLLSCMTKREARQLVKKTIKTSGKSK